MADLNSTDPALACPPNFEADLTDSQVKSMERAAATRERGVQRRLCLVTCAQNAKTLEKIRAETPEAFMDMFRMIEAFKEHAQGLAKVSEAAYMRMLLIGAEAEKRSH
jgi:hypothetical protein